MDKERIREGTSKSWTRVCSISSTIYSVRSVLIALRKLYSYRASTLAAARSVLNV